MNEKKIPVFSQIKPCGGVPALYVNGEVFTSVAYMTYLEKYNRYEDFTKSGYDFFSVPVLFSGRWVSATDGFTPFKKGIFDVKNKPHFSLFDEAVEKILSVNREAYIIPRVNMCMPVWWEKENPGDVNIKPDGTVCRESLYSEKYRADAEKMLREFIRYVNNSKYASHIIGYQLAGGNTEEWFHFDLNGGYCKNAENGFKNFLESNYPELKYKGLPDLYLLNKRQNYFKDKYLSAFLEYASVAVAEDILQFASAAKEETHNNLVVGTFYGYSLEVTNPLWGTHALGILLNSPDIDFICSPNSYIGIRSFDCDWTEMYPADSVRLHGKMCFQECDIRTHLTVHLHEKDSLYDPKNILSAPVWDGLKTKEKAENAVKKSFVRQLVKGNGLWWFDMWGGWFSDSDIMYEMSEFRRIYSESLNKDSRKVKTDIAVFTDETSYKYLTSHDLRNAVYDMRKSLGLMGTPYCVYDVFDFPEVYKNYKAVIFTSGVKTENMQKAINLCEYYNVPYIKPTVNKTSFSAAELREFCKTNGVFIYCETDDIVYINDGYVGICAVTDGEKIIKLGKKSVIKELFSENEELYTSTEIKTSVKSGEVKLFEVF